MNDPHDVMNDEACLDEFESAWLSGQPPAIDDFLDRFAKDADRDRLLAELVRLDLEYRFKSGGFSAAEIETDQTALPSLIDYKNRFPGLQLSADLIEDEWRLCRRHGDRGNLDHWRSKYPPDLFDSPRLHAEFVQKLQTWLDQDVVGTRSDDSDQTRVESSSRDDAPLVDDPLGTIVRAPGASVPGVADGRQPAEPWAGLSPRFERETLLGEGSFGVVWRAYDCQLQRHVAIKTLHPELAGDHQHRDALVDEARTAAALDHPDLLTIHDVIVHDRHVHLVMRLVEALPMDQWWQRVTSDDSRSAGRSDSNRILAGVMARVARAVHHAHLSGLIHCDLKPQNVLVDDRGNPTVLDFGLAIRRCNQDTLAGRIFGTPAYMSPEQSWGETHHLDGRSDVWSLGVMLYRLIAGTLPFQASTTASVLESIQTRSVVPPAQFRDDIPQELSRICLKCLNKRIEDRYATAAELAGDLQRFADEALTGSILSVNSTPGGKLIGCPWGEPDLVGRDEVIRWVVMMLDDADHRLVTLTGIGGIGKTQTAASIAKRHSERSRADVIWVDAATASNADQFAAAVLAALGVTQQADEPSRQRVAHAIAVRGGVTLVLDNVEQVIETAAEQISDWLSRNQALRLIVTSQLPLRIRGEQVRVLDSLSTDRDDQAVELFVRRASAVKPNFAVTAEEIDHVREICRLVDGNPLAIELAAARVGVMKLPVLRDRLSRSFGVLKSNRVDRPDRHRTLGNVVRWSVELLDQSQWAALNTLAIWPAPIPMRIAEALVGPDPDGPDPDGPDSEGPDSEGPDSPAPAPIPATPRANIAFDADPIDLIDELRQRHLLRLRDDDDDFHVHADNTVRRYVTESLSTEQRTRIAERMLRQLLSDETSRSTIDTQHFVANLWAAACWLIESVESGESTGLAISHAANLSASAVLMADRVAADQTDSQVRIERIERVLSLSSTDAASELEVRLADAKRLAGQTDQAEAICRRWLAARHDTTPDRRRETVGLEVETRCLLSLLLFRHGHADDAIGLLEAILDSAETTALKPASRLEIILDLTEYHRRLGHLSKAVELLKLGQAIGDRDSSAEVVCLRPGLTIQEGKIALQRGRIAEARNLFDQALGQQAAKGQATGRAIGRAAIAFDPKHLQQALLGRAAASAESGDYEAAERDYDRCEKISRRLGDLPTLAQSLNNRALAADDAGESQKCCDTLQKALEIYCQLNDSVGIAICLAAQAAALLQLDRPEETIGLLNDPRVKSHLPPDSIHQAIAWGDLATAQCRLGQYEEARKRLSDCVAKLDQLNVGPSAERLLYEVERVLVLNRLGDDDAIPARKKVEDLVAYWEKQPRCRERVRQAVERFRQLT